MENPGPCVNIGVLKICQNGWERPIHLNQVEIYDSDNINRAREGLAEQSSNHFEHEGFARDAIDGNTDGTPNHTAHMHGDQWWAVSFLEKPIPAVRSYTLYNVCDFWDGRCKAFRLENARIEMWSVTPGGELPCELVYHHTISVESDPELFTGDFTKTFNLDDPEFEFVGRTTLIEEDNFVMV